MYVVDETDLEAYSCYAFEKKCREVEKLAIEETGHGIDLVVIDPVFGIDEAILIGLTSILGIAYKYVKGSVDSVIETGSMKDIDKEDLESIAYTCANMINSGKNKTKVKTK